MIHEMLPGRLWQGSVLDGLAFDADIVVTCSPESELTALRGRRLHVLLPFADAAVFPDMVLVGAVAEEIAHLVALPYRVLIHCTAGKNRSGLVTALVLHAMGKTGPEALAWVRERNPDAFTAPGDGGPFFAEYLARLA